MRLDWSIRLFQEIKAFLAENYSGNDAELLLARAGVDRKRRVTNYKTDEELWFYAIEEVSRSGRLVQLLQLVSEDQNLSEDKQVKASEFLFSLVNHTEVAQTIGASGYMRFHSQWCTVLLNSHISEGMEKLDVLVRLIPDSINRAILRVPAKTPKTYIEKIVKVCLGFSHGPRELVRAFESVAEEGNLAVYELKDLLNQWLLQQQLEILAKIDIPREAFFRFYRKSLPTFSTNTVSSEATSSEMLIDLWERAILKPNSIAIIHIFWDATFEFSPHKQLQERVIGILGDHQKKETPVNHYERLMVKIEPVANSRDYFNIEMYAWQSVDKYLNCYRELSISFNQLPQTILTQIMDLHLCDLPQLKHVEIFVPSWLMLRLENIERWIEYVEVEDEEERIEFERIFLTELRVIFRFLERQQDLALIDQASYSDNNRKLMMKKRIIQKWENNWKYFKMQSHKPFARQSIKWLNNEVIEDLRESTIKLSACQLSCLNFVPNKPEYPQNPFRAFLQAGTPIVLFPSEFKLSEADEVMIEELFLQHIFHVPAIDIPQQILKIRKMILINEAIHKHTGFFVCLIWDDFERRYPSSNLTAINL